MPTKYDADRVPVAPFREAFLRSGMTSGEFARAMGYTRNYTDRRFSTEPIVRVKADTTRGRRVLGIVPWCSGSKNKGGRTHYAKTVSEEDAYKMLDLFPSLDPVDVGL